MIQAVVLVVMFAVAAICAAPATQPDIESLITQLSSDNWKDRQHAQDELVKLGAEVRPRLEQLSRETASDEVRTRAQSAIQKIAEVQETGTSFVTIHMRDAEVRDVFAELQKQCHAPLEPAQPQFWENARLPKVSIDIENQPFWGAMREISEKTGIELVQWNDGLRLVQTGGAGQFRGPACVSGPFLIVANRVNRSDSVDLSGLDGPMQHEGQFPAAEREFTVQFSAFAEPKLRISQAGDVANLTAAFDELGNSFLDPPGDDPTSFATGVIGNWPLIAHLRLPDNNKTGTRITTLKGSVKVVLDTRIQTIEIPSILDARNVERSAGDQHFVFKSLQKTGEQYQLTATAMLDRARPDEFNRLHAVFSSGELKLLDARGQAWNVVGRNINGNNNSVEVTIDFSRDGLPPAAPGDPSRLVMKVPTETKDVTVPFEFSELPIP